MSPIIFGLKSTVLSKEEIAFFKRVNPVGFILFARNVDTPAQVKKLVVQLRHTVGRHVPVLIDQEGGRVARLRAPHWEELLPLYQDIERAKGDKAEEIAIAKTRGQTIGAMLADLGIDVNCAPVADLYDEQADPIISDRSFSKDPKRIAPLARAFSEGMGDYGVASVVKHIPGHGRASCDSHLALPIMEDSLAQLEQLDFLPFTQLNDLPYAMTAHMVFTSLDKEHLVTFSKKAIDYIRKTIGFTGILMTDDLSMHALNDVPMELRGRYALNAGCDVLLHCNGEMEEMEQILSGI